MTTENPFSKDKALEALDFIVNVLKEHENSLDGSIDELQTVTREVGKIDELNDKVADIEEGIDNLQKQITNLLGTLLTSPKETFDSDTRKQIPQTTPTAALPAVKGGSSIVLSCKQWSDFEKLSMHSQTLTFNIQEADKTFQVNALKGNQIMVYSGQLPVLSSILTAWLSQQLDVPEQNIVEGNLSFA